MNITKIPKTLAGSVHTSIAGIPCIVDATYIRGQPYEIDPCDTEELEIHEIMDRKGYKADWLSRKLASLSEREYERFEQALRDKLRDKYEEELSQYMGV